MPLSQRSPSEGRWRPYEFADNGGNLGAQHAFEFDFAKQEGDWDESFRAALFWQLRRLRN